MDKKSEGQNSTQKLVVNAKSWQKDSFGLFDFESKDVTKQQF